ncbi:MAG: BrnT family toxin [Cyanobacteria bacterium P01_A01_bin.83]
MRFEWDENKNRSNIAKHGIDFEQAKTIFEDPNLLTYEDTRFNYGEVREISIGQLLLTTQQKIIIALVVYTDRDGIIRLISARKASKQERKAYEQQSI